MKLSPLIVFLSMNRKTVTLLRRCTGVTKLVVFIIVGYFFSGDIFAQPLFDHGVPRIYRNDSLTALKIPIGGIGAGCVRMNGDATRDEGWWIWGEWEIFPMKTVTNSFFGIRAQAGTSAAVVRALQTVNQGNFQKMNSLTFRGEYPFGWYDFTDAALPVKVSLEVFNPLIPLDSKNSAIPCAIYSFTMENTGTQDVTVDLLGTQQNCIGTGVLTGYGSNINSIIKENGSTILSMESEIGSSQQHFGNLTLMAYQQSDEVAATASWGTLGELLTDFSDDGALTGADSVGPTGSGQTLQGALSCKATLTPGQKTTITYVLTWYFPNRKINWSPKDPVGPKYATWWTSALDVAHYCNTNLADLTQKTRLYHETFYDSNLPYWMLDGAANNTAILRTPTVFWNKDGYFGANEGWRKDAHIDGNCTHVSQYSHAHAYLFPDIARTVRDGVFEHQWKSDGAIYFRINESFAACDGQYGEILSVYREYQHSTDGAWLTQIWAKTKKAMEYAIKTWDSNEDGVLSGWQWTTLDGSTSGNNSWLGSMYLASLAACEKMATIQGDAAFATKCAQIRAKGVTGQDTPLFDTQLGYYVQKDYEATGAAWGDGCEIDMLRGQTWASVLGLGYVYPKAHMRTALQNLYKNNFYKNFIGFDFGGWRRYVDDNDAGLIICTWSTGVSKPSNPIAYNTECQAGYEYGAACAMIGVGLLTEGFTVFKAIRDRYRGKLRTNWWTIPGASASYGGDPFMEVEWGYYYFRSLASWAAIPASQGFFYDGPGKAIGFHPVFKPEGHSSFFIGSEGYGRFSQARTPTNQLDTLALKSGKLTLKQMDLYMDSISIEESAEVRLNGAVQSATVTFGGEDGNAHIVFDSDVSMTAGDNLTVTIGKPVTGIGHNTDLNKIRDVRIHVFNGNIHLSLPNVEITPPRVTVYTLSGKKIPLRLVSGSDHKSNSAQSWKYTFSRDNIRLAKGVYLMTVIINKSFWAGKIMIRE